MFNKLRMHTMLVETDPFGNFLMGIGVRVSARVGAAGDYLQDGVWNREPLLPEGFVKFVSTPLPRPLPPPSKT